MKKLRNAIKAKKEKQARRSARVREKLVSTTSRPRMAVYRSNKYIYVQIIDDTKGHTLAAASDLKLTEGTKTARAAKVGEMIAEAAKKAGIEEVAFDRNGYKYTGRVKALAEAARNGGLKF
jgi:large subunit ribosomal protein L18